MSDTLHADLLRLGTATVYEASGLDCALQPGLEPAWPGAAVAGPAYPVRCHPADNLALHLALELAPAGAVLVADGSGVRCGYFGEVMAVAAQTRAIAGLVIDGGVRDHRELETGRFPVHAVGSGLHRTSKHRPGLVGVPITVRGVAVAAGDVVIADADGVVVVPQDAVHEVHAAALVRQAREEAQLDELRAGRTTVELFGLARPGDG